MTTKDYSIQFKGRMLSIAEQIAVRSALCEENRIAALNAILHPAAPLRSFDINHYNAQKEFYGNEAARLEDRLFKVVGVENYNRLKDWGRLVVSEVTIRGLDVIAEQQELEVEKNVQEGRKLFRDGIAPYIFESSWIAHGYEMEKSEFLKGYKVREENANLASRSTCQTEAELRGWDKANAALGSIKVR